MKKRFNILLAISVLAILFLTGCVNFSGTDTSVWSGGMWIALLLTIGGTLGFGYSAYKSSKSGSTIYVEGQGETESNENVPLYKIGTFWYAVVSFIATLILIYNAVSNR